MTSKNLSLYLILFQGCFMAAPFSFDFPEQIATQQLKTQKYITASDGTALAYYDFIPENPGRVMIFYHGGGAWSMAPYQYMAQLLLQKYGIGVYLFDIRGHENSQGPRGDAPSSQQLLADITTAIDYVYWTHPKSHIILGGHSSGGGLILNYSEYQQNEHVKGYVFLAPFLGPSSGTFYEHADQSKRFVKRARLFPLVINMITGGFFFSHTPVIFFNYPDKERQKDPLLLQSYTCSMAQATTPYNSKSLFARLNKQFILLIGAEDEQFIPEKTIAYADYAQQQIRKTSYVGIIQGGKHLSIMTDAIEVIGMQTQNW